MRQLGHAEISATRVPFEELHGLLRSMSVDIHKLLNGINWRDPRSCMPLMLLLRNATGFCYMWSSAVRNDSACRPSLVQLQDIHGRPLKQQILACSQPFPSPAVFQWQLPPNGTKPKQSRWAGALRLSVLPDSDAFLRLLRYSFLPTKVR